MIVVKRILVIGSLNMDLSISVDHLPAAGETIIANSMQVIPGGKGANQAFAVGKLGGDVTMLGAVGRDEYGAKLIESLKGAGVKTDYVIIEDQTSSGMALISVDKEGENSIVVIAGANNVISVEDIEAALPLILRSDIVILQLEIPFETVLYAAKVAKREGKYVVLDPAPIPNDFSMELLHYVDVILPNETELDMLTGSNDKSTLNIRVEKLQRVYDVDVIVTLGGKGVYLSYKEAGDLSLPARKVELVDSTAAGDAFTAAFSYYRAEGNSMVEAVRFARDVSGLVVTRKGAQSSIPSLEEVQNFILINDG